jgi:hypothetical protein
MSNIIDAIIKGAGTVASNFGQSLVDNAGRAAMGGAGLLLVKNAYDRLGDVGQQAYTAVDPIAEAALTQSAFKPFTVTTGMGGRLGVDEFGNVDIGLGSQESGLANQLMGVAGQRFGTAPTGTTTLGGAGTEAIAAGRAGLGATPFGLSGQQQAASQAFGLGGQFMQQAGMPTSEREQEVFERIRATQLGEEERQRLALEERLFAQGRGGVQTSMFGGTPEQLALAKAQESAQNQAALMAIEQAQAEQRQQAALGSQFAGLGSDIATQRQALEAAQQLSALQALQTGQGLLTSRMGLQEAQQRMGLGALTGAYIPQAQSLNALQQGLAAAGLQQRGQLYGAGLFGEAKMTGLEALLGASLGQANLIGQAGTGLLSGAIG